MKATVFENGTVRVSGSAPNRSLTVGLDVSETDEPVHSPAHCLTP